MYMYNIQDCTYTGTYKGVWDYSTTCTCTCINTPLLTWKKDPEVLMQKQYDVNVLMQKSIYQVNCTRDQHSDNSSFSSSV